ncbi:hypothetical protein ES708_34455 [subsurface metagenome]
MVKLKSPLLSLGARGLVGSICYLTRRKTKIAEKTPVVPDAKSLAQLSWRHMYQKAVALWHALSADEKREWERTATPRHMTGFAWFMSQCLRPNPSIYLPLQGGTMQGIIEMANYHIHGLPAPVHLQDPLRRQDYVDYIQPFLYAHGARVYHSLDQSIPNFTWYTLAFDSERYDTDDIHDTVTNNSRLTCQTAGKYVISGSIVWSMDATGDRSIHIRLNGSIYLVYQTIRAPASMMASMCLTTIYDLAVDDYVELRAFHNLGNGLTIYEWSNYSPEFMMQRIGA